MREELQNIMPYLGSLLETEGDGEHLEPVARNPERVISIVTCAVTEIPGLILVNRERFDMLKTLQSRECPRVLMDTPRLVKDKDV